MTDYLREDFTMTNLPALVREGADTFVRLSALVADAEVVQWEAAPVPRPREDTTERASGEYADPTPSTSLDARRLAVREAHDRAVGALREMTETGAEALRLLEEALLRWEGNA